MKQTGLAALDERRAAFRAEMDAAGAERVWRKFDGRIALVLPGGGARGAYEAGVLLAFQDAGLPTHMITATSIGGINSASYAANSDALVGNAEAVVQAWRDVTPVAVGIEWTRYAWMLAGLIATSAGIGNLFYYELTSAGLSVHLRHPAVFWATLALAGASMLLLHTQMPYLYFVARRWIRGGAWQPDPRRLRQSALANLLLLGFAAVAWETFSVHTAFEELAGRSPVVVAVSLAALVALLALSRRIRSGLGRLVQGVGRLLVRSGLFQNYERRRFLQTCIPWEGLRRSPIRLLFAATDLETGSARFFCNTRPEVLSSDPGADPAFIAAEVSFADDPMGAVMATSALPLVYEPIPLGPHHFGDGGIVANQPIRPAVRLGADVVFLVMVDAPGARHPRLDTFIDVGRRAVDILIQQNVQADLATLERFNHLCRDAALGVGLAPEEIELEAGDHRYRYVRPFTIRPRTELGTGMLDFGDPHTLEVVARGYQDAGAQLREALAYAGTARFSRPRRVLRLAVSIGAG